MVTYLSHLVPLIWPSTQASRYSRHWEYTKEYYFSTHFINHKMSYVWGSWDIRLWIKMSQPVRRTVSTYWPVKLYLIVNRTSFLIFLSLDFKLWFYLDEYIYKNQNFLIFYRLNNVEQKISYIWYIGLWIKISQTVVQPPLLGLSKVYSVLNRYSFFIFL